MPSTISHIEPGSRYLLLSVLNVIEAESGFVTAPRALHFLIAPNVTPRSRCLRSRNVKTATGNRNSTVPAAIAVQSVIPDPSCDGMNGGAVCARRLVIISAKAYSFHAVMKQNTAVAAIP